jgi:hypothetical protein
VTSDQPDGTDKKKIKKADPMAEITIAFWFAAA